MILVTGEGCILMIPLGGGVGGSSEEHLEEGIKGSVFACLGTGGSSKLFNWYPERSTGWCNLFTQPISVYSK